LISTYSKAPHYAPHDPHTHEPDTTAQGDRDEIGLVRSISVKVCLVLHCVFIYLLNGQTKERSSAKRKDLYKQVQVKAGVSTPTQLLLDMKVRWSSTYVMVNRAESSKEVRQNQIPNPSCMI
jgi:hypothetical protein